MEINLRNRVALVTGAGRGIGRVIAETYAREGMVTIGVDLAIPEDADQAPAIQWETCDIADAAAVTELVDGVVARHGTLDVLVNNAGVNVEKPADELTAEEWDFVFAVNVRGTFNTCRAATPHLKKQRSGRILNAASFAAIIPSGGASVYAASKSAVVQFSRTLASELGPWGITVNSYAPGMIPTLINRFAELPPEDQERRLDQLSIRRWGTAEDIANLLCFLASDLAGYITGTLVDVSGGKFATQMPGAMYARAQEAGEL